MNQLSKAAAIMGRKGGQAGTGESKARSTEICRAAALKKWRDPENVKKRFWSKVRIGADNECWPWIGAKGSGGYGSISLHGKHKNAHRVAYELTYGSIDQSKDCCHSCDNPPCCNPKHLFMGTAADNMNDCLRKGRRRPMTGERNPMFKMNTAAVISIRERVRTGQAKMAELAREYGVDHECIRMIVHRISWKHI
jgi:hypothetical protein